MKKQLALALVGMSVTSMAMAGKTTGYREGIRIMCEETNHHTAPFDYRLILPLDTGASRTLNSGVFQSIAANMKTGEVGVSGEQYLVSIISGGLDGDRVILDTASSSSESSSSDSSSSSAAGATGFEQVKGGKLEAPAAQAQAQAGKIQAAPAKVEAPAAQAQAGKTQAAPAKVEAPAAQAQAGKTQAAPAGQFQGAPAKQYNQAGQAQYADATPNAVQLLLAKLPSHNDGHLVEKVSKAKSIKLIPGQKIENVILSYRHLDFHRTRLNCSFEYAQNLTDADFMKK